MARLSASDRLLRMQHQLTDRDWRLMGWLYDHRVLTSFQIANALFPSLNFAQRRLTDLVNVGVLMRFRPFREGGGSYPYHYCLTHSGALIIAGARRDRQPRRNEWEYRLLRLVGRFQLDHRLGINQFFTDLAGHERTNPAARLHYWWPDTKLERFAPPGTATFTILRADSLGVWSEDGQNVVFYLEHDTGTEALSVLVDKVDRYNDRLCRSQARWPVLFWLHSTHREAHLHRRLAQIRRLLPVATAARDRLDGRSPAEQVWQLHGAVSPLLRLAELPMLDPAHLDAFDAEARGEFPPDRPGRPQLPDP